MVARRLIHVYTCIYIATNVRPLSGMVPLKLAVLVVAVLAGGACLARKTGGPPVDYAVQIQVQSLLHWQYTRSRNA